MATVSVNLATVRIQMATAHPQMATQSQFPTLQTPQLIKFSGDYQE